MTSPFPNTALTGHQFFEPWTVTRYRLRIQATELFHVGPFYTRQLLELLQIKEVPVRVASGTLPVFFFFNFQFGNLERWRSIQYMILNPQSLSMKLSCIFIWFHHHSYHSKHGHFKTGRQASHEFVTSARLWGPRWFDGLDSYSLRAVAACTRTKDLISLCSFFRVILCLVYQNHVFYGIFAPVNKTHWYLPCLFWCQMQKVSTPVFAWISRPSFKNVSKIFYQTCTQNML